MDDTGAYSDLAYTLTLDITATSDNPTASNESVLVTEDTAFSLLGSAFDTNFADVDLNILLASKSSLNRASAD